jgi:GNAT superfamily N-acetyltransferase
LMEAQTSGEVPESVRLGFSQLAISNALLEESVRQIDQPEMLAGKLARMGQTLRSALGFGAGSVSETQQALKTEIREFQEKSIPEIAMRLATGETYAEVIKDYPLLERAHAKFGFEDLPQAQTSDALHNQQNELISFYRNTRNSEQVASLAESILAQELSSEIAKIPDSKKTELLISATKEVEEVLSEVNSEGMTAEELQGLEKFQTALAQEKYTQNITAEAVKSFDASKLTGAKAETWKLYNDSLDPQGEALNISDARWNMVRDELAINAPMIIASGGVALGGRMVLSQGAKMVCERMFARQALSTGLIEYGASKIPLSAGAQSVLGGVATGTAGLLTEGALFEVTHLGLQGQWLGNAPDWAEKILWTSATLGVIKKASALGESAFGKTVVSEGVSATQLTQLGTYVEKISDPYAREIAKTLLVKGHAEVAGMMIVGAVQNGVYQGNLDEFMNNFGDDLIHSYVAIGSLKSVHLGMAGVKQSAVEVAGLAREVLVERGLRDLRESATRTSQSSEISGFDLISPPAELTATARNSVVSVEPLPESPRRAVVFNSIEPRVEDPTQRLLPQPSNAVDTQTTSRAEQFMRDSMLTPEQERAVRKFSREWLETVYESGIQATGINLGSERFSFGEGVSIQTKLAEVAGSTVTDERRYFTPEYRESIGIFMNELIDFVEARGEAPGEHPDLLDFMNQISQAGFSSSPNVAEGLGLSDQLILAARANSYPEVQSTIGSTLIGELTYNLAFADGFTQDHLVGQLREHSTLTALNLIRQLETIGADAIANGSWAEPAAFRAQETIEAIAESHPSPLVGYASEVALSRLEGEWENPTLGVVQFSGDPSHSRLPAQYTRAQSAENEHWSNLLNFEGEPHLTRGLYLQLSSNAVGVYDHSGSPKGVGRLPSDLQAEIEGREEGVSFARLNTIYDEVSSARSLTPEELVGLVNDTERMVSIARRTGEDVQFVREGVVGEISRTLPELRQLNEGLLEETSQLREGVEEYCLRESENFMSTFEEVARANLDGNPEVATGFQNYLRDYKEALSEGHTDSAFSKAEQAAVMLKMQRQTLASLEDVDLESIDRLISAGERVRESHIWAHNYQSAGDSWIESHPYSATLSEDSRAQLAELEQLRTSEQRQYVDYVSQYRLLAESLTPERVSAGHDELNQGLSRLYDAEMSDRPVVDVQGLHEVATDQDLNPFKLPNKLEDRLLFQMLHQVETRAAIEADLGISLNEIPLREQIHFLRYLSGQDQQGFDRLRGALQKHPESANQMLRCFLANAEDVRYADRILDIAENLDPAQAQLVFGKYLEIADAAGGVRDLIASESGVSATEAQLIDTTRNLLHRANEILVDTAERTTVFSVGLDNGVQRLDRVHGDLLLQRTFLNEVAGRELTDRQSALATQVETLVGGEVGARDRYLLREIAKENTEKMYVDSPPVKAYARQSFQEALRNPNSKIIVARTQDNQPLSFLVLTNNQGGAEKGELYLGSYNTDPFYQSLEFGNELFSSVIEQYGTTNPIRLYAYAGNQAGINFYQRHGFQIIDSTGKEGSDSDLIEMYRPAGGVS